MGKENEIPEDILEFIEEAKKEDKKPVEMTREQFFLEVNSAFDFYAGNHKIAQDNMQIAINLIAQANMFEQNPDIRVTYLRFPDGKLGVSVEPKGKMGFKFPDERKDGEDER